MNVSTVLLIANSMTARECSRLPTKGSEHFAVVRFNHCLTASGKDHADMLFLRRAKAAGHLRYFGIERTGRVHCPVRSVDTIVLTGTTRMRYSSAQDAKTRLKTRRVLTQSDVPFTTRDCNLALNLSHGKTCTIGAYAALFFLHQNVSVRLCGFTFYKGVKSLWHDHAKEVARLSYLIDAK